MAPYQVSVIEAMISCESGVLLHSIVVSLQYRLFAMANMLYMAFLERLTRSNAFHLHGGKQ